MPVIEILQIDEMKLLGLAITNKLKTMKKSQKEGISRLWMMKCNTQFIINIDKLVLLY